MVTRNFTYCLAFYFKQFLFLAKDFGLGSFLFRAQVVLGNNIYDNKKTSPSYVARVNLQNISLKIENYRSYFAVGRYFGFKVKHCLIIYANSAEYLDEIASYFPFIIFTIRVGS